MFGADKITSVFIVYNEKGRICRVNSRETNGLVLVPQGKYVYKSDGKKISSDRTHVIFLPKGSKYEFKCLEKDDSCLINFDDHSGRLGNEVFSIQIEESDNKRLLNIFKEMNGSILYNNQYEQLSLFYKILDILFTNSSENHSIPKIIKNSVEYLNKNFCDSAISNDILAKQSNISTVYFRKVFTRHFKMPPIKYVQNLRIEKAKRLLKGHGGSVSQIAYECGYSSVYYFSVSFKEIVGIPPTEYAKKYSFL